MTWRLVIVSLVVGVVLAVVSVPVGAWASTRGPSGLLRSHGDGPFVHERDGTYYERRVGPVSTLWTASELFAIYDPSTDTLATSPEAIAARADISMVPSSPLPERAQAALAGPPEAVEHHDVGWPWRAAWGMRVSQQQPAQNIDTGLRWIAVSHDAWAVPYLPLWPGLLGNTLFYTLLVLTLIALWRWRTLRRRERRGLCPACGYELGEGVSACPECGLARAGA